MTVSDADWATLADAVDGIVHRPGSRGYDAARRPAIANFDGILPAAVVQCASPADVAETLAFARRSGLQLAVRSGGHSFAGTSSGAGLVLDVSRLRSVGIVAGTARVGAGTRLGEVYQALAAHRLTIPAGCGPTVGIAGLTLGGGIGLLGRRFGLTCDRLVDAEVVLADGTVVECDSTREPDLFWALRGAGDGMPGVVTWLRFATVRQPAMTAFRLSWPPRAAAEVVAAWQEWAPDAPDDVAASLLVGVTGDRDPVVNIFGATSGVPVDLGIEPMSSVRHEGSYLDAKREFTGSDVHGLGEPLRGHTFSTSQFFDRSLPAATIGLLIDHLYGPAPGIIRRLDLVPMGGAYNRVPADATAFVHRADRFLLKAEAVVPGNGAVDAARQWVRRAGELARPDGTGRAYQNFPDPSLGDAAYLGGNLQRLRRVQRLYDPDGVLTPARPGTAG